MTPSWLPPVVDCNGVWREVVAALYAIFMRDFTNGRPSFRGRPIWWDRRRDPGDSYEIGFWHLISRDDLQTGDRLPDFRRAERLPWCRPVLDHEADQAVLVWNADRGGGDVRTYLWLRDLDYVVVLQRRALRNRGVGRSVMFLVTAYHVDGDRTRKQLEGSYASRVS